MDQAPLAVVPPPVFTTLQLHLSEDRLQPYLLAASGNYKNAVKLYQWNVALSGAVYEGLHVVEVILRNAIDGQLRLWNPTQLGARSQPHSADWLHDPSNLIARLVPEDDREKMKRRAATALGRRRVPCHSDLVAQSTFGTWRFLLPDKDPGRQYIWAHAVRFAFPNLERSPEEMTSDVDDIYSLRNRVAHLEPILHGTTVKARYEGMRRVLAEISIKAEQWFTSNQRITSMLGQRPSV